MAITDEHKKLPDSVQDLLTWHVALDTGAATMTELMAVIGIVFLLFRVWLVEIKLPDELQFRRRYLSRVINYYTALSFAFSLSSIVLNLIVMISFPILLVTTGWDVNFYRRFRSRDYWKKNRRWLILERLTLHPPVFGLGLAMILLGAEPLIRVPNLLFILAAAVLLYVPFFLFDARWTDRYNWPQAPIVILLVGSSSVAMALAQVLIWGVPLW